MGRAATDGPVSGGVRSTIATDAICGEPYGREAAATVLDFAAERICRVEGVCLLDAAPLGCEAE